MTDFEDIESLAKQSLTKPPYFGYWGSKDMFKTWGMSGFNETGASDLLEKSNFKVISEELQSKYPDDFRIEKFNHWAAGWVNSLTCRVLKDENGIGNENITDAFKSVIQWHERLDEYALADEDVYYSLLTEECIGIIEDMPDYLTLMIDTANDGWAEKINYTLNNDLNFEFNPDIGQYPNDNKILEAVLVSNLCNPLRWGEWNEWCDEQGFDRPNFENKENPNQLKLFED
jgi:hypothetical protein